MKPTEGSSSRYRAPTWFRPRHFAGDQPVPGCTDIIQAMGLDDDLSKIDPKVLRAAADRGQRVHNYAKRKLLGEPITRGMVKTVERGYCDAVDAAIEEMSLQPILVEQPIICRTPILHGVTPDFYGWAYSTQRAVIDWKTFKVDNQGGKGFQLIAQRLAIQKHSKRTREARDARLLVITLKDTGRYEQVEFDPRLYERRWLHALDLWAWRHERGY